MFKTDLAQLLNSNNFQIPLKLNFSNLDYQMIKWLSLVYQLNDCYEDEILFIEKILEIEPNHSYILERKKWHALTEFEKYEPRKTIYQNCDFRFTPSQKILDNLCIITGGDSNYFEFIIECIESIKATKIYKDIDLHVLDAGLIDHEKQYLWQRWKLPIFKTGWPIDIDRVNFIHKNIPKEQAQYAQAVMAEPFFQDYLKKYHYFMWIDPDTWVQDEQALNQFVLLAEKQGNGFSSFYPYSLSQNRLKRVPKSYMNILEKRPMIRSTVFCNSSSFQRQWKEAYTEAIKTKGFWWSQEEDCAAYLIKDQDTIINNDTILFAEYNKGRPVTSPNNIILKNPENLEPIGIFILPMHDKKRYYWPVIELDRPLTPEELKFHIRGQYSGKSHQISLRYRTLPWKNKDEIKQILINETNRYLSMQHSG